MGTTVTDRLPVDGDKAIVIRISDELHAALKERAEREERPMAQVMRRALRDYVTSDQERESLR